MLALTGGPAGPCEPAGPVAPCVCVSECVSVCRSECVSVSVSVSVCRSECEKEREREISQSVHGKCMTEGEKEMVCALRQNGEGRHYVERVRKKMVKAFGVL